MVADRHILATYRHVHCFPEAPNYRPRPTLMTLNDLGIQKPGSVVLTPYSYFSRRFGIVVVCRPSVRLYVTDVLWLTGKF